jgi:adenine-specific DNA-methyltransferase
VKAGKVPQTLWKYDEVGHNQESKKELIELLPIVASESVFETPKPVRLVRRMLELATLPSSSDLVLDFFGGSGTTGHSLIAKNADDSGNRRYICVQLPVALEEPAELKDGVILRTISEITKERLRRAGKKVKADNPMFAGDTGFRVFKLDSSNIKTWDPDRAHLTQNLLDAADNLKEGRTEQDVLYEVLLKLGLDLCMPIQTKVIADFTVSCIGGGTLFVCLARGIDRDKALDLGLGLIAWRKELAPVVQSSFVFRDSGFVNDVAKTNLVTTLEQTLENDVLSIRSI